MQVSPSQIFTKKSQVAAIHCGTHFKSKPISGHLEWSFVCFVLLSTEASFLQNSASASTKIWSAFSAPKGLLRPSQKISSSNWIMATIKYENQLSVISFPNVTSKTADAKPNPRTLNMLRFHFRAAFDLSLQLAEDSERNQRFLWSALHQFSLKEITLQINHRKLHGFALKNEKIDVLTMIGIKETANGKACSPRLIIYYWLSYKQFFILF